MNTKSIFLGLVLFANAELALAHGVTNAKASELSLHRIERLVALCNLGDANRPINIPGRAGFDVTKCKNDPTKPKKGINPDFQNKIFRLNVEALPHQNEEEPSFKTIVTLYKTGEGNHRALEIFLDEEGRPLTHQEISEQENTAELVWPDKDSATLSENALHYILEGAVTKPELKPYNENLQYLTITQGTNAQGQLVAIVDFVSTGVTEILRVRMKTNGEFDSAEFIN
jgi:hypothetical protein